MKGDFLMGLHEGMSIADAMALKNDDGMFGGNGTWIFFLFFLLAWGGNGFGNNSAAQGALTRAEMFDGFNAQDIKDGIRGIQNGICDGFYAANTTTLQGFNGISNALCQGFNSVNSNITDVGYQMKDCCCQINRNIDASRYEAAKNTCDIITAGTMNTRDIIDSQNQGFQRILDFMTNDKIESLRTELQAAQLQLGNINQTSTLINALRPYPQPAYITCSPYTASNVYGNCTGCCV
jgi:hypothetical protein